MTRRSNGSKTGILRETSQDPRKLKRLRFEAGLTIRQLAEKAGVGIGTISEAERGLVSLHVDTLTLLAAALGCQNADLMPEWKAA